MSGGSDAARLVAAADRLKSSAEARRGRALVVVGMIAVIVAFALLSLYLGRQATAYSQLAEANARDATLWRSQAQGLAKTLADTHDAAKSGNWRQVQRLLSIASSETSDLQHAAAAAQAGGTPAPPANPQNVPALATTAPKDARTQLVYIQFAGFQRDTIANLNQKLRAAGWNAQSASGERLALAAGRHEVRYHGGSDQDAATALAAAVGQALGKPVVPRRMDTIVPGTLELWISQ